MIIDFNIIPAECDTVLITAIRWFEAVCILVDRNRLEIPRHHYLNRFHILKKYSLHLQFDFQKLKQVGWCQIRRVGCMIKYGNLIFCKILLNNVCGMWLCVVVQQAPTPGFTVFLSHAVDTGHKSFQDIQIKCSVDCPAKRNIFMV